MQDYRSITDTPKPRRASPRLVVQTRAALRIVRPYAPLIAKWQSEAVYLRTKLAARASSVREQEDAIRQLKALMESAEGARQDILHAAPPGRLHGRVEDTCRALKRFADLIRRDVGSN